MRVAAAVTGLLLVFLVSSVQAQADDFVCSTCAGQDENPDPNDLGVNRQHRLEYRLCVPLDSANLVHGCYRMRQNDQNGAFHKLKGSLAIHVSRNSDDVISWSSRDGLPHKIYFFLLDGTPAPPPFDPDPAVQMSKSYLVVPADCQTPGLRLKANVGATSNKTIDFRFQVDDPNFHNESASHKGKIFEASPDVVADG
jgi:hypothetical protein